MFDVYIFIYVYMYTHTHTYVLFPWWSPQKKSAIASSHDGWFNLPRGEEEEPAANWNSRLGDTFLDEE